jgi:hypothetical protein
MSARYTGRLERAPDGTITGWIQDEWQWRITLFATRAPGGGYTLTGELGEVPETLRFPLLDGPAKASGEAT